MMQQPVCGAAAAFRMASVFLNLVQHFAGDDTSFRPKAGRAEKQRLRAEIAEFITRCDSPNPTIADCQLVEQFLMKLLILHWRGELFDDPRRERMAAFNDLVETTVGECTAVAGANDPSFGHSP